MQSLTKKIVKFFSKRKEAKEKGMEGFSPLLFAGLVG